MKQAMWKIAPSGDFSFRDRFAGMDVILGSEVDTGPLRADLLKHFAGQAVTIEASRTTWLRLHRMPAPT
jgi:hypothetical protein